MKKKYTQKIPETFTIEEMEKILKATKKKHHKIAFILGFFGGMRISEILKLKQEDIDRGQKLLRIKQAKGKKDRNIPIPKEAVRGLNLIPLNYKNISSGSRSLEIAFKQIAKKVLNRDLHFHNLRHSGATHKLNKEKWNIREVQQWLGHAKLDTTMIYTVVSPDDLVKRVWGEE